MTTPELSDALRAEILDLIDALQRSNGQLFSDAGKRALERMRRINELLALLEKA